MQLRHHPLMTRRSGIKSWPPLWVSTTDAKDKPRGEVGMLQRVSMHPAVDNGIYLWIDYRGLTYIGFVHFDDVAFCRVIHEVLNSHIRVSIKKIGDINLSFTL